ncbi:hypothetical protein [uncultured Psychrobacter sp.]|uniref:hypothetical protein n=1 Tax=uncultured Psychrobacter sp. TaxID=259303 RepID=UPI0030DD00FE|tara:strand:- start:32873 stop:33136 length:264 start_codon:yes stop_codon:yes gene_type:complete
MNNRNFFGIITATIGLCTVIAFFNAGMENQVLSWPSEAYFGLTFSIGWLTNLSASIAYLTAALIFILIAVAFYRLGSWIYGLMTRQS